MCEAFSRWVPPQEAAIRSLKVHCGGEVVSIGQAQNGEIVVSVWAVDGEGNKTTSATIALHRFAGRTRFRLSKQSLRRRLLMCGSGIVQS